MRSFQTFSNRRRYKAAADEAVAAQAAAEAAAGAEYEGKQKPSSADQNVPEELLREPKTRLETWQTVDAEVEAFKSKLEKIWREGDTFNALRQQSLFTGLWVCVGIAVLVGALTFTIDTTFKSALGPYVDEATIMYTLGPWIVAGSGIASAAISYAAWLFYQNDTLVTRTENKLVSLSNEISGRLISFLIEDGPDTINEHKDHIKIDSFDNCAARKNCVNDMMIAWRKMQLTPYQLEHSWMVFKFVHILRHNKKNRRPLYYLFSAAILSALAIVPAAASMIAPVSLGFAPFLAAGVSYALLSFSWKTYLRQRMEKLLGRIEEEITCHMGDGEKEAVEWKHVVARYDPTPDLAESLFNAHTFITDANRTGRRHGGH